MIDALLKLYSSTVTGQLLCCNHQLEELEAEVQGTASDAALRSSWVSEMGRALGHSPEEDSMMPVPCEKHSEYE